MQRFKNVLFFNEPLVTVLERLQSCQCRLLSVTEVDRLVGIINLDNIMELIRIQTALQERQGRG